MNSPLHFIERGQGLTTLIFLHFFGGCANTWKDVMNELQNNVRCIAIDLPGFGASPALPETATVERVVSSVMALIDELTPKEYWLIGHSMGGKIAMAMASKQPRGLQGLVLVAPSPPTPEPIDDDQKELLRNDYCNRNGLETLVSGLVGQLLLDTQSRTVVDDHFLIKESAWNDWIDTGCQEDISDAVKNIKLPVMVITGEKDPNFSTQFLKKQVGGYLLQATFVEIAGAGHLLPVEKPGQVASVIASFCFE